MEYVQGEDLKGLISRMGALSEQRVIRIAKQVCEGLAEAHRLRIVHRDLKPQNIMIDEEDNARILDFGLARSLKEKGVSEAGIIIGTPYYMSPEQVEGIEADERADIYSFGVNLYEIVTGKVPFEGDTSISIALKNKTEEPVNPQELNDKVSENMSSLILKCMAKDREHRYQAVEEFLFELRNIEEGIPITTGPLKPHIPAFLIEREIEKPEIEKPVFVARKQELERLESFLDDAMSGNGRAVFITGEAGSGKTALVQEFSRRLLEKQDDLIVASGNCNAHTGIGDPYLPFRDVLGQLSGDVEARWAA